MEPGWFRLLDEQRNKRGITWFGQAPGGRIGLTPVFLVGALRVPVGSITDQTTSLAEFHALLGSMRDYPSEYVVRILECGNLHQPLASLTDGATGGLEPIRPPNGLKARLYASPEYFGQASRDVESLASGLWRILGQPICEGRFSYRRDRYQPFSKEDLDLIQRALERDADDDA